MQLKVIDFNARFMQDYMQWCQEQEGQEEAQEQMEDQFYELYESWKAKAQSSISKRLGILKCMFRPS